MRGIHCFLLGFFIFSEAFGSIYVPLKGPTVPNSSQTCQIHFDIQEKDKGLPEKLLSAISTVESKHKPWAINAQGESKNFKTKEEAANYIRQLRAQDVRNINVGCMQLNWESHAKRFKSPEDMLEPSKNVGYAAQLVKRLIKQHGSVEKGVRFYHSSSSTHNIAYKNRVYAMWFQIKRSPSHQVIKENKKLHKKLLNCQKRLICQNLLFKK